MNVDQKTTVSIFVLFAIFSFGILALFNPLTNPYTVDSLTYISTAQHLNAGRGLLTSNFSLLPVQHDDVLLQLFPPGFSFLIYCTNFFGVNAHKAAVLLPRVCLLFLPIAFFYALRQVLGKKLALGMGLLFCIMFSTIKMSLMALSDMPFLLFVLLSFIFLERALNKDRVIDPYCVGLCVGIAMLIRHVGYAVLGSMLVGLTLGFLLKQFSLKKYIRLMLGLCFGAALIYAPYLIHNYVTFGSLQTYVLPPSELTVVQNGIDFFKALSRILFGLEIFFPLVIALVGLLGFYLMVHWPRKQKSDASIGIDVYTSILFLYFFMGGALVIWARSRYWGAEPIGERYCIQYAWILIVGVVHACRSGFIKGRIKKGFHETVLILGLLCFVFIQYANVTDFILAQKIKLKRFDQIHNSKAHLQKIPEDYYVVSNVPELVQLVAHRNVRMLGGYTPLAFKDLIVPYRHVAVVLLRNDGQAISSWLSAFQNNPPKGFKIVHTDSDVIILIGQPA